jgi:restriction system protein
MSVPSYQEFMNPVLQILVKIRKGARPRDIENAVADLLELSDEDRLQLVPSGIETTIRNRTGWACFYLMKAGLLERSMRGFYKVSGEGLKVIESKEEVNNKFLMKYRPFAEFKKAIVLDTTTKTTFEVDDPETKISKALEEIIDILEQDLLDTLKNVEPEKFERIVIDLMEAMDYGIGQVTRHVGDGGIDGVVNEDELGLDKIYLQVKRYTNNRINEKEMRDFVGALETSSVNKGVFITTSFFSEKSEKLAKSCRHHIIRLVDGKELVKLMIKYNLGVKIKKGYEVKEIDNSFFE